MQLVTFQNNGSAEPGALVDGKVVGLKSAGFTSLLALIEGGKEALTRAKEWVKNPPADQVIPLAKAKLLAPLPHRRHSSVDGAVSQGSFLPDSRPVGGRVRAAN